MNALWRRQFDIDENETNCVNYKYCLVDAAGVSDAKGMASPEFQIRA